MERILRTGEKNGVKRSMLVVGHGLPIAVAVSGANVHATQLLQITLDNIVTERPDFNEYVQNSCLDAGYTGYYDECAKYGYVVHIRPRGEEKKEIEINSNFKARCRIVEVVHFRINRFKSFLFVLRRRLTITGVCFALPVPLLFGADCCRFIGSYC